MKATLAKPFALILLLLAINSVWSQDAQQLRKKLQEPMADADRVSTYLQIADTYLPQNPDSARMWMDRATKTMSDQPWTQLYQDVAKELLNAYNGQARNEELMAHAEYVTENYERHKSIELQNLALKMKGVALSGMGKLEESKAAYLQQKLFLDQSEFADIDQKMDCYAGYYSALGITYAIANDMTSALECFLTADSLLQYGGSEFSKSESDYCLGSMFFHQMQPKRSNKYFKRLERGYKEGTVTMNMMPVFDNMANNYMVMEKYDSAKVYLDLNLVEARKFGDSSTVGFNFFGRGKLFEYERNYREALNSYQRAIQRFEGVGNVVMFQIARIKYVAACVEGQIELESCIPIADELIEYYEQTESLEERYQAYEVRAKLRHLLGMHKEAFDDFTQYDSLKTKYMENSFGDRVAELETKYETDLHKREAEKQAALARVEKEENSEKSKLLAIIGAAAVVLLIILIALVIVLLRLRESRNVIQTQKLNIEQREKEKSVLLKELHHRVKNNLQIVSSLLNLQQENAKEATAKGAFKEGQNRVEAMAMIHQYLYTTDELTTMEMGSYITKLVNSIAYSYGYDKREVELHFDIEDKPINVDLSIPIGLIANELVSNAFKHAFKEVAKPMLRVKLRLNGNLKLSIHDNGPGFGDQPLESKNGSFGMDLINSLIKQLRAEMNYTFDNGTRIELIIPSTTLDKQSHLDENSVA